MLIVDPFVAHLSSSINSWRDQDVRSILAPLARMAEALRMAVLCVVHLNKKDTSEVLTRVSGSIGIPAAARSVFLVAGDPDDETGVIRFLAHAKANLSAYAPTLRFRIEGRIVDSPRGPIHTSAVAWMGEAQGVAASELLTREDPEDRTAVREAEEWLRDFLAGGDRPANEGYGEGAKVGIARRTLERAKAKLGVRSRKRDDGWRWTLPEDRQPHSEKALYRGVGDLGDLPADATKSSVPKEPPIEERQPSDIGDLPTFGKGTVVHETVATPLQVDDGRRAHCRALAPLYGWPRCEIAPGVTVLAGDANWLEFLDKADDAQVLAAVRVLSQLDGES